MAEKCIPIIGVSVWRKEALWTTQAYMGGKYSVGPKEIG
jgi:hypothetical protein